MSLLRTTRHLLDPTNNIDTTPPIHEDASLQNYEQYGLIYARLYIVLQLRSTMPLFEKS